MSNNVEERVVGLKFDNAQFESATKASMSTIDRLKSSLNFTGVGQGLDTVANSARNVNMSVLGSAVDAVQVKFSALQVVAMATLANITNSLLNVSKNLVESVTTAPISAGFKEYESGLNAFQTIMANTRGGQKTVAIQGAKAIGKIGDSATKAASTANAASLKDLQKTQTQKIRELEKSADSAVKIMNDQYEQESDAMTRSIRDEKDAFDKAHEDRLDAYDAEYMAKLKATDTQKYEQLKAIDAEISAIKGQTKTEQDAIDRKAEQEKLASLQFAVDNAKTAGWKVLAEKDLADYKTKLARDELLRNRDAQIENLQNEKSDVNAKYDQIELNLKNEYQAKKDSENEQYKIEKRNLDDQLASKEKALNKTHQLAKQQLTERNAAEKQALQDQQNEAMDNLRARHALALSNIKSQGSAQSGLTKTINVKASSVEEINAALAELNKYANDTIYSFGDMTSAIGLFTAQGVGLKDSITGIKGIFNLVSMTGGDATKANSAIYQLSQAIASGTVRAQDWISVVNAGIGGTTFQNQLMQTAKVHGVAVDKMIAKQGSFKASLEEGWLTSDILLETLSQYTGDLSAEQLKSLGYTAEQIKQIQKLGKTANDSATKIKTWTQLMETLRSNASTGWATTFKTLFGDLDEATALWTAVGNSVGGALQTSADARNKMLSDWKEAGGRTVLVESLTNVFKALVSVITPIHDAFKEIFPPTTGKQLLAITTAFRNFTKNLALSDTQSKNLKDTFKGLFSILDIIRTLAGGAISVAFKILSKVIGGVNGDVLSVTGAVGNLIVKFHDWLFNNNLLIKGFDYLIGGIKVAIGWVKDWFKAFVDLPIIQDNIKSFQTIFEGMISAIKDNSSEGMQKLKSFIDRVKDMNLLTLDGIKMAFKDFKDNVLGYFLDVNGSLDTGKETLRTFKDYAQKNLQQTGLNFDALKQHIGDFVDYVKSKLSNIGLGQILTVVVGGSLILLMKKIATIAETFSKPFSALSGMLSGLKDVLKAYSMQLKANALLKVAIAIGVLAASIAVLSLLDQTKVWSAVGALGVLAAGLVGISAAIAAINKIGGSVKGAASILTLTAALLVITMALKNMQGLDPKKTDADLVILTGVTIGLVTLAAILGKGEAELNKGSAVLLAMAGAVVILVGALLLIDKMDLKRAPQDVVILLGMMTGLVLVARACDGVVLTSAASILAIAISLRIIVGALSSISKMKPEKVLYALGVLLSIFTMFGVLMTLAGAVGPNATAGGLAILAISASLLIIVMVIKQLAKIDASDMAKAVASIAGILVVFAIVVKASEYAGEHAVKAGVMLLMMAGTLLILSIVITILSSLDPSGLARATLAIVALSGCFALLIAVTKLAEECKTTLIILSVTIGVLAIALATLAMIDPKQLASATLALSTVIAMFAVLVASTSLATNAVVTLGVLTVVVLALGAMLYKLADLPADSTLKVAEALSVLLLSLSASCLILSAVGVGLGPVLLGLAGLATVVVGLGALLIGIGALVEHIPQMSEWLDKGIPILQKIGFALGSFFGEIIGGFAAGVMDGLPSIGKSLSLFMTAVKPFFDGVKGIDTKSMEGVKALAETVLILTGASLLQGLTSWLTGGSTTLTSFADELISFGPKLKTYVESIKGLDSGLVTNSATAAKALAEMANNLQKSGGIIGEWVGNSSLSDFADQLVSFGPKLMKYSLSVKGLDTEVVTNSANAAKALAEMAKNLPNSGGILADWVGDNTLTSFANQLVSFGPALMAYAQSVSGLDTEVVTNSANAAKALGAMASDLPDSGGKLADWMGDNTLVGFANQLIVFGPALMAYATSVTGLDAGVVTNSANAAKALSALASGLPSTGGFGSWFSGSNDMATFGQQLVSFGISLSSYNDSVSTINTTQLANVIVEFKKLVDLATGISNVNVRGMTGFSDGLRELGNTGISEFISAFTNATDRVRNAATGMMQTFIDGANSMTRSMISAFTELMNNAIRTMNDRTKEFNTVGGNCIINFINGINSQSNNAVLAISNLLTTCVDAVFVRNLDFWSAGSGSVSNFIEGIKTKSSDIKTSFVSGISDAITVIRTFNQDFNKAGEYLVQGFIDGINKNIDKVKLAAHDLAQAAADSSRKTLDEHSPSKVFTGIGDYAGIAFVNALVSYASKAYTAGKEMAVSAKNGLSTAISKLFSSNVVDNLNLNPTITPVLDLSNVRMGANTLNALLSQKTAYDISADLQRKSSDIQNGESKEPTVTQMNFEQNIYSPEAVDHLTIYRQTKNQFSAAKGAVDAI